MRLQRSRSSAWLTGTGFRQAKIPRSNRTYPNPINFMECAVFGHKKPLYHHHNTLILAKIRSLQPSRLLTCLYEGKVVDTSMNANNVSISDTKSAPINTLHFLIPFAIPFILQRLYVTFQAYQVCQFRAFKFEVMEKCPSRRFLKDLSNETLVNIRLELIKLVSVKNLCSSTSPAWSVKTIEKLLEAIRRLAYL